MNSVNKPLDAASGEADSQAIQMFNAKFTSYAGKDKSAQDVKSLCMLVQSINATDSSHQILLRYKVAANDYDVMSASEIIPLLDNNNAYSVVIHYTKEFKNSTNSFYGDEGTNGINLTALGIKTDIGYISVINIIPK